MSSAQLSKVAIWRDARADSRKTMYLDEETARYALSKERCYKCVPRLRSDLDSAEPVACMTVRTERQTEPAYIRAASQRLMATQSWATKPGCAIFAYVHMCACVHA